MSEIKKISIPWGMIILNSFLIGAFITVIGSGGIFSLAFTEGLDAAFLYLSYVPVIVLAISAMVFVFIVIMILIHSSRWARYFLSLVIFLLIAIPLTPIIFMPHVLFGGGLLGFAKSNFQFTSTGEFIFAIIVFPVLFWWMLVWSRGLYRMLKGDSAFVSLWKFVQKYANDRKGSRKRLEKLIADVGKRQALVPNKIKRRFRRSSEDQD